MLIYDSHRIGEKLFLTRKKYGLTQAEVAEKAGVSDRTYADIERGTKSMRVETLLKFCMTLNLTPDDLLTDQIENKLDYKIDLLQKLETKSRNEQETAWKLLSVYLDSLE